MDTLWARLAELSEGSIDDDKVHCERLHLADGALLDVHKAERAEGAVTMWRVRGFYEAEGADAVDRQAVILGTKDGRAIVRFSQGPGGMEPVQSHQPHARPLSALSAVLASAVRKLMDPGD
ncbi:MAG: hypothetical protein JKY37_25355 [Nannocystaceae bacterium]|nr:hypothetical protein [Nannocystaceae bacterium]